MASVTISRLWRPGVFPLFAAKILTLTLKKFNFGETNPGKGLPHGQYHSFSFAYTKSQPAVEVNSLLQHRITA